MPDQGQARRQGSDSQKTADQGQARQGQARQGRLAKDKLGGKDKLGKDKLAKDKLAKDKLGKGKDQLAKDKLGKDKAGEIKVRARARPCPTSAPRPDARAPRIPVERGKIRVDHRREINVARLRLPLRPFPGAAGFTGVPPAGETRFVSTEMVFQVGPNVSRQAVDARRAGSA